MTSSLRCSIFAALLVVTACSDSPSASSPASPDDPPGNPGAPSAPESPGVPSAPPAAPSAPPLGEGPPATPPLAETPPATPETPPPSPPVAPVVVGSGTGRNALNGSASGSRAILISADKGLYVLGPALAGEPHVDGEVYVSVNGTAPPADTTVEINGVPLVRRELPGSPESPFRVDVAGPQPEPDAEGMVTITVRSGALVKTMSLPCPPDLAVTSSAAPDSYLRGKPAVQLSWDGDIEANTENPFPTAFTTAAKLMHYRYDTHVIGDEHYSTKYVAAGTRSVSLDVAPSDDGFCAELRWQGKFFQDGNSRGFCGRAKRIEYRY